MALKNKDARKGGHKVKKGRRDGSMMRYPCEEVEQKGTRYCMAQLNFQGFVRHLQKALSSTSGGANMLSMRGGERGGGGQSTCSQ